MILKMCNNEIISYWYNLEEIENLFNSTINLNVENPNLAFEDLGKKIGLTLENSVYQDLKENFKDVWMNLENMFGNYYVLKSNKEILKIEDDEENKKLLRSWWRQIYQIYIYSKDKYLTIINLYKENKDKLMNDLETIRDFNSKYNDTPQASNDGSIENDNYLSSLTRNHEVSKSDVRPVINKIDDINKIYRNLVRDWSELFVGMFIPEENL